MSSSSDPFRHRPGKSSREVGDVPAIGYVPRMHKGVESRAGRRTRRIRGADIKVSMGMVVTAGLVVVGMVVIGLLIWVSSSQRKAIDNSAALLAPLPVPVARIPLAAAPEPAALEEIVRSFLTARSPEALAPVTRPSDVPPATMIEQLAKLEEIDGKVKSVNPIGPIDSQTLQLEAAVVYFEGNRKPLARLSPDAEGKWKVDFDAYERHVSTDWATLLAGEPAEGIVRVYISPDSYYNGSYRDDSRWACFGMVSPDSEVLMFGYVARDSHQYDVLNKVMAAGDSGANRSKSMRMTLEIRHSGEADHRQFEISRVLADDWALGTESLEDKIGETVPDEAK